MSRSDSVCTLTSTPGPGSAESESVCVSELVEIWTKEYFLRFTFIEEVTMVYNIVCFICTTLCFYFLCPRAY